MRKIFSTFSVVLLATIAFHVNANLWLIGGFTPSGWVTNSGLEFTQVDNDNYTLEVYLTATGQQYYSLTTQLASAPDDWDAIRPYRFGGDIQVNLNTPTVLEPGTDASPYTNINNVGLYVFDFNISTRTLTVSAKDVDPTEDFNGTIYITTNSVGNVWAWDDSGNYFNEWPGKAINTLDVVTVAGNNYYQFTYTHNTTNPGLIFSLNGSPQTPNLVPIDGKLYYYDGGYTVEMMDMPDDVVDTDTRVYILGNVGDQNWAPNVGVEMEDMGDGIYKYTANFNPNSYFSFTTKLASSESGWDEIKEYRFGATEDGYNIDKNLFIDIALGEVGLSSDNAFYTEVGTETTIELDLNYHTVKFTRPTDGIDEISINRNDIVNVIYVNPRGQVARTPFDGFNIKISTCRDGSAIVEKMVTM